MDKILIGGKRKGKPGRGAAGKKKASIVVEKDARGGVKRAYFSTLELRKIFDRHIDNNARVVTDLWRSYTSLSGSWNITRIKSNPPKYFQTIHRFIQQLKSWIRGIYHKVSDGYLQGYLDGFCFRINRHLHKETNFDTLLKRMMIHQPVPKAKLLLQ